MAAKAKTTSKSKVPAEPLVAYKGFNRDLTCTPEGRSFQYEIGKTYDNGGGPVVRCGDGAFHWVEMPLDAFTYYGPATGRYAIVEPSGEIAREENSDTKGASSILSIKVDISIGDLTRRAVAWVAEMARKQGNGQFAAGYRGHASAAGDYGHASAAGYRGHASPPGITATPLPPGITATPLPPGLAATPLPPGITATPLPPGLAATPLPPGLAATPLPPGIAATPLPPGIAATPLSKGKIQLRMRLGRTARPLPSRGVQSASAPMMTPAISSPCGPPWSGMTVLRPAKPTVCRSPETSSKSKRRRPPDGRRSQRRVQLACRASSDHSCSHRWHELGRVRVCGDADMSPREVLDAIRDLVEAAEMQGWDALPDLKPVLDRGREAYADLQVVMADGDDDIGAGRSALIVGLDAVGYGMMAGVADDWQTSLTDSQLAEAADALGVEASS
ncbi:MAG: hypothetical protein M9939_26430 [Mesorhizobium sp.]|nr:hypothetical protein [Mesorhizobium sp.]MCO5085116.1 hypothetical protein [Rhizobiaceae bacterium]MCO5164630.1 hypothetical protein [Mesorhizobium sp.]